MRDPVLAGVLSLIIPGVGQLYNGRILAGTLGWVCHVISAYCAYSYAKDHPYRT